MTNRRTGKAIDLMTYNGHDPFLIHESACQNCHAKQSEERQLTLCSTCSVVWYCSEACMEADFDLHIRTCDTIARNKAIIDTKMQELREQHQIEDPFVPKENTPFAANRAHKDLEQALTNMARNVYRLAQQGGTKELWESLLDWNQKLLKMKERRSWERLHVSSDIAFTLIRLNRLEDAWRFIRNALTMWKNHGISTTVIEYQPQDRFTDCLEWVSSSYWPSLANFESARKELHCLILALIIIKLRIRAAADRNAWHDTINNVFLRTIQGRELVPVQLILEGYFSHSYSSYTDDPKPRAQICDLVAILHCYDSSIIPRLLSIETALSDPLLANAFTCLHRTPEGPQLLFALLNNTQSFKHLVVKNRVRLDSKSLLDRICYNRLSLSDANSMIIEVLYWRRAGQHDDVRLVIISSLGIGSLALRLLFGNEDVDCLGFFMAKKWDMMLLMAVVDLSLWLVAPKLPNEVLFGLKDAVWTAKSVLRHVKARLAEAVWGQ